ncbi:MAG: STAS domain-containing protein [Candidatus Gracilibacteria bacterium]|nr:STAS domain-containing protein [Candidatus Gracilibacteria bacterium]
MSDSIITFIDSDLPDTKIAKFVGQLDETNIEDEAKRVYAELEGGLKNMVFDFTELSYLNSKSIGYIADWQGKVTENNGKLVIFGAAENIFDILDVVGLTKLIEIVDDLEGAKGAL